MEEKKAFLEKFQAQRANWKDLEDMERINLEFIHWGQNRIGCIFGFCTCLSILVITSNSNIGLK
jgi:hypothetical protein